MKLTHGLAEAKSTRNGSPFQCAHTSIIPKITTPAEKCEECQKCADICPKKVFTVKDEKIDVRDLLACTLCMDCVEACPKKPAPLKIEWEKNAFIMNIESTGALPPERVLKEATKNLGKQLNEIEELLKAEQQ